MMRREFSISNEPVNIHAAQRHFAPVSIERGLRGGQLHHRQVVRMRLGNREGNHLAQVDREALPRQAILRLVNRGAILPHQDDAVFDPATVGQRVPTTAVRGVVRQPIQFRLGHRCRLGSAVNHLRRQCHAVGADDFADLVVQLHLGQPQSRLAKRLAG